MTMGPAFARRQEAARGWPSTRIPRQARARLSLTVSFPWQERRVSRDRGPPRGSERRLRE